MGEPPFYDCTMRAMVSKQGVEVLVRASRVETPYFTQNYTIAMNDIV